jgi:hypothetical protein
MDFFAGYGAAYCSSVELRLGYLAAVESARMVRLENNGQWRLCGLLQRAM